MLAMMLIPKSASAKVSGALNFNAISASCGAIRIRKTPLMIPPEIERKQILNFVFEKIDVFDKAEEKCSAQITLLQERRSALISAAVTGKIDVRNWQAPAQTQLREEKAA